MNIKYNIFELHRFMTNCSNYYIIQHHENCRICHGAHACCKKKENNKIKSKSCGFMVLDTNECIKCFKNEEYSTWDILTDFFGDILDDYSDKEIEELLKKLLKVEING